MSMRKRADQLYKGELGETDHWIAVSQEVARTDFDVIRYTISP